MRVQPSAVACGDCRIAEAMTIAQQKEGFSAKVLQRKGAPRGEFMLLWEHGKEGLGEQWRSFKLVAAKGKRQDGDVERTCPKAIQQDGRDFLDDGDLHLREFSRKRCQERRQEVRRNRGNDADSDAAADGGLLLDDVAACRFEFAENGPGSRQKRPAKIGEANGTAKPIEQTSTEFVFELEDLLRQ
jgi:hypothetical protein